MQGLTNVAWVVVAFTLVACSNESDGTPGGLDGGVQDGANSDSTPHLDAQNEQVDAVEDALRPEDAAADEGGGDASVDVRPEAGPLGPFCMDGEERFCYPGPDGTKNVGLCHAGRETCSEEVFGPCEGMVVPSQEDCNGLDDDCDGQVDEECLCTSGDTQACGTDLGECEPGSQACDSTGSWGPCEGAIGPVPELCNGLDDDCDDVLDDFLAEQCYAPPEETKWVGPCKPGLMAYDGPGLMWTCQGYVYPEPETCDGVDNDCNGVVDDGC